MAAFPRGVLRFSKQRLAPLLAGVAMLAGLEPLLRLPYSWKVAGLVGLAGGIPLWYYWWSRSAFEHTLTPVGEFSTIPRKLIFTYGSLLVRDSILRTIAQSPSQLECIPCDLRGYRLTWGAASWRPEFIDPSGRAPRPSHRYLSLVIERGGERDVVNGAVIGLSREDYLALKSRETSYRLADVTSNVLPVDASVKLPNLPVETFMPAGTSSGTVVDTSPVAIRKRYLRSVGASLKALGFKAPALPPGVPIRDAVLVSELIEPLVASPAGQEVLRQVHRSISQDMSIRKEHRDTAYTLRPLVLPKPIYEQVQRVAEAMVSLSTKALELLNRHHELARWSGYTDEDLALLEHAAARGRLAPQIVRVDLSLQGHRLRVFEVNADSPGGMRHLDIVSAKQTGIFSQAGGFDWIDFKTYSTGKHTLDALLSAAPAERPVRFAAILEYKPRLWPTYPEMQYFQEELSRRPGVHAEILDVGNEADALEFSNGRLRVRRSGREVDLVYKRILWTDARRSHPETARALVQASLADATTFVNSLGSRMAGNKMLLAMINAEDFPAWLADIGRTLTEAEREVIARHLPKSFIWGAPGPGIGWRQDPGLLDRVMDDPIGYVLKSYHGFGGEEVLIGAQEDRASAKFLERIDRGFIVQDYVAHGRELMPLFRMDGVRSEYQFFVLGAYVINGHCVAVEAKTSSHLPINMSKGAFRTAVFPTR